MGERAFIEMGFVSVDGKVCRLWIESFDKALGHSVMGQFNKKGHARRGSDEVEQKTIK